MADLYMQMCMKCQVTQDCYAHEDGYICMECFDARSQGTDLHTMRSNTTYEALLRQKGADVPKEKS